MSSDPRPHCACGRPYDPHPDDDTEECWVCSSDADERGALGFGPDDDAALDCEDGICGGSGVCPDCDEGQANHGLTCRTCLGTGDCPGCVACGDPDCDERENEDRSPISPERAVGPTLPDFPVAERAILVEHASTPTPSSPGVDAAVPPAGPVPPRGPAGGAALGGLYLLGDGEREALAEARALLIALSEMDPCPDCGATTEEREEGDCVHDWRAEGNHHRCATCNLWHTATPGLELPPRATEHGHAADCGIATWLRLYGGAP